jgi:hypothetical protein
MSHKSGTVSSASDPNIERIWRGKLKNLCRLRFEQEYGAYSLLPNNDEGKALLTALLRFGLTDEKALKDAPWCKADLTKLKRQARRMKWRDDVGKLIGLTFAEWKEAKLWILRPIDASEQDIEDWRKEQRKNNDAERKRKKRDKDREEREATRQSNKRNDTVLRMLKAEKVFPAFGGWTTISALVKQARKCVAFRCPNGSPPRGLRVLVHRTVKRLEALGLVETKLIAEKHGKVLYVQKTNLEAGKADAFGYRNTVTPENRPKAADNKGFTAKKGVVRFTIESGGADIVLHEAAEQDEKSVTMTSEEPIIFDSNRLAA